ncbi:uncharacterized protein G2W53_018244 [Senna tora]|uniref:Uncharacterized protein n=1 Tax=Senna tora TaxID=362788 RepID=A0A834TVK4_9FABA|nr:uncharacterized protein G2W53_018244 [Senna tora]
MNGLTWREVSSSARVPEPSSCRHWWVCSRRSRWVSPSGSSPSVPAVGTVVGGFRRRKVRRNSLHAVSCSVSLGGHLKPQRIAVGDSQTMTTTTSDHVVVWNKREWIGGGCWRVRRREVSRFSPFHAFSAGLLCAKVSVFLLHGEASPAKNLKGVVRSVGRRDNNGSDGLNRNDIRENLAQQNDFKITLKIHLDPNGKRRMEWVLERRVPQPRSPLRFAFSKDPPESHQSQHRFVMQPNKRVNWALQDTTQKNGTKMVKDPSVEELGQVKAQSSLEKIVNSSEGGRNESIRPLALTWVAKGVDKAKKVTEMTGSVLGATSGEGNDYNSSTHASSKEKWVIQEVDLGPSCSGTKVEMTNHSFFDTEPLSSDTSDTETVDADSLISHFENEGEVKRLRMVREWPKGWSKLL